MKNKFLLLAFVVVALFITSCASQAASKPTPTLIAVQPAEMVSATATLGALDGCVPSCIKGLARPGNLPAGEYQTRYFFGGRMRVTLDGDWTSGEDSTGEFTIAPSGSNNAIFFWEDVYPLENGARVNGVPMTAAGLLDWLSKSPRLTTTSPVTGSIGASIPATIVDVSIANGAHNEDPGCVGVYDACILFLGFPQWDAPWGIAGNQVQRLYLADVSYGGVTHLFVAVIYPDDSADMENFRAIAEPLIASVRVPVDSK